AELRDALRARGVAAGALDAIAAPAGLDIGARTPEEIALSVMAQIVERRRRAARATPEEKAPAPGARPGAAIDPVCGSTVAIAGAPPPAGVDGGRSPFCCAGCRSRFLAAPAHYPARERVPGP